VGWTVRGSIPRRAKGFFSPTKRPHQVRGPPSLLFKKYRGYLPRGKEEEPETNHSHPSGAEEMKTWRKKDIASSIYDSTHA
jgi:hypothetical protein